MTEIASGIHQIATPLGERDNFVYLLVGDERALLFDTGCDGAPAENVVPYLASIGVEPDRVGWVLSSHCDVDHFGGFASAREAFPAARLGAHRLDAPMMEDYAVFLARRGNEFVGDHSIAESGEGLAWMRSVTRTTALDVHLSGGERFRLSADWVVDVVHVPGHSRGHLALWDARSRTAIVSDAVLSDAVLRADGSPAFPPTYRHVSAYRGTISVFEAMAFDNMLTAHYPDMDAVTGAEFLSTTRSFVDRLEAAVLRELASGPKTAKQIIGHLNPTIGRWPEAGTSGALAFPVVGHLEDLASARCVRSNGRIDDALIWELA